MTLRLSKRMRPGGGGYGYVRARKYRNKVVRDAEGFVFHSKRELARWEELKLLERAGEISDLRRQVPITLQAGEQPIRYDNGRQARLVVDFAYRRGGELVYEDSKGGVETPVSKLKRAIARAMGIEVQLVK